jgi:hypothetical protein
MKDQIVIPSDLEDEEEEYGDEEVHNFGGKGLEDEGAEFDQFGEGDVGEESMEEDVFRQANDNDEMELDGNG